MPYQVRSLIDHRVVLITVSGLVTMPQIRVGGRQVDALLSAGEPPVHVIIDISQMTEYPTAASMIYGESPFLRNANLGYIVAYGVVNPLLRVLLRVIGQMASFEYRVVQSLPEAIPFLHEQDSRIDQTAVADPRFRSTP